MALPVMVMVMTFLSGGEDGGDGADGVCRLLGAAAGHHTVRHPQQLDQGEDTLSGSWGIRCHSATPPHFLTVQWSLMTHQGEHAFSGSWVSDAAQRQQPHHSVNAFCSRGSLIKDADSHDIIVGFRSVEYCFA